MDFCQLRNCIFKLLNTLFKLQLSDEFAIIVWIIDLFHNTLIQLLQKALVILRFGEALLHILPQLHLFGNFINIYLIFICILLQFRSLLLYKFLKCLLENLKLRLHCYIICLHVLIFLVHTLQISFVGFCEVIFGKQHRYDFQGFQHQVFSSGCLLLEQKQFEWDHIDLWTCIPLHLQYIYSLD